MASKHFETTDHAAIYQRFRPSTPDALIQRIMNYVTEKFTGPLKLAIDVGCGTGQSTEILSPYFSEVHGVDVSEEAIEEANKREKTPNVTYWAGPAEKLNFPDNSVNLVTVGQAFHWFNIPVFMEEVKRILAPGGTLALYCYIHPCAEFSGPTTKDLTPIIEKFFSEDMNAYWTPEVKIATGKYHGINIPLEDLTRDETVFFELKATLAELVGHISTWSAFRTYQKEKGKEESYNTLMNLQKELLDASESNLKPEETELTVRYNYFLLLGRKAS